MTAATVFVVLNVCSSKRAHARTCLGLILVANFEDVRSKNLNLLVKYFIFVFFQQFNNSAGTRSDYSGVVLVHVR